MSDRETVGTTPFERSYPAIARWITEQGWIELGQIDGADTFARALDEGGMVWEGQGTYGLVDDALQDMETALGAWMREQFGE